MSWENLTDVPADFADGVDDADPGDGRSLDAADGSPTDMVYVDNDGEVGVGTTSPSDVLEVRVPNGVSGGLTIRQTATHNGYPTLAFNVAGPDVASLGSHQVGLHLYLETRVGKGNLVFRPEEVQTMTMLPGNVGIGTNGRFQDADRSSGRTRSDFGRLQWSAAGVTGRGRIIRRIFPPLGAHSSSPGLSARAATSGSGDALRSPREESGAGA